MQFFLHGGEKLLRHLRVGRVVDAGCVDVQHLLVETPFRGADVADALEELVEVVGLTFARRVRETLVVHGEALHQVLGQACGRPLAKLRAAVTADAVADGEDGFQAVVAKAARNRPITLPANL